jgi:hypothetical protein
MKHTKRLPVPLDAATLRELAVRASTDPRTILHVASGMPVRGLARHRARAALIAAGYPLPDAEEE